MTKSILLTPVQQGGLGAPDIHAYYCAKILDQLKTWWSADYYTTWKQIESTALSADLKLILAATWLKATISNQRARQLAQ